MPQQRRWRDGQSLRETPCALQHRPLHTTPATLSLARVPLVTASMRVFLRSASDALVSTARLGPHRSHEAKVRLTSWACVKGCSARMEGTGAFCIGRTWNPRNATATEVCAPE